jgi:peptidyl-prolyl cis-trans isomerase C
MNRQKQIIVAAGLMTVCVTIATAQTDKPAETKPADKIAELFGDPVVAKGAGMEIKRSELDAAVMGVKASGATRGQQLGPEQALMLERQVLDRLMQIELLNSKASAADKAKGKEEAKKRYDIILERAGSEENLARQLKSVGMSADELNRKMADEATAEAVVVRELKAEATDADVKKYYDEFPARFEQPEMVHVSHILLASVDLQTQSPLPEDKKQAKRKLADDLLKRARAGEDFAKLVREYSEDSASLPKNGEYTFPRASADPRRAMVPEFETAAFALGSNEVSDVVTTQYGYHIIKLKEKKPARKVGLDETIDGVKVNEQVRELLKRQNLEKVLPPYIAKLQEDAKVEVLDEKLKQAGEKLETARIEAEAARKAAEAKPDAKKSEEKK